MPKKHSANKDLTQKVDKNRPKSKSEKKEEQKKHKLAVSISWIHLKDHQPIFWFPCRKTKRPN